MAKVSVVTGANKGIGYAICKSLFQQESNPPLHVILTARDNERGIAAVQSLQQEVQSRGNTIEFHCLDIENEDSISQFVAWFCEKHKTLDILINNAGIAYRGPDWNRSVALHTNRINYFGTRNLLNSLLPLINKGGRVVNVSSRAGNLSKFSAPLQAKLLSPSLTEEELSNLVTEFIESVEDDSYKEKGFPQTAYGVSKVALNALTQILARKEEYISKGILINSCCPGWVRTDMGGEKASKSPDEGAETPVWLALLPEGSDIHGAFCAEKTILIPLPK